MSSFADFKLIEPLQRALSEAGYTEPTPIQTQAIPAILNGGDVVGIAQTGTGKTAAFVLPIAQRITQHPKERSKGSARALILVPTRELAMQIAESFNTYGKHLALRHTTLYGGVPQTPQVHSLARGVDIIIATPGRLLDLYRQGFVRLEALEVLVLDEADRMLDMGFAEDIRTLAQGLPKQRQTLLFSATFSQSIASLAHTYLHNPTRVTVTAEATTVGKITQIVHFVDKEDKVLLLRRILESGAVKRAIVFVAMKHVADRLVVKLAAEQIVADAIHSDKTQAMRTQAMNDFRSGKTRVLIATDIAARGIDVDDITHVINYELPKDPETYVHRIGRTARAGASGIAISFCSAEERNLLNAIERLIGRKLDVKEHKYHSNFAQKGGVMANAPVAGVAKKKTVGHVGKSNSNHAARKSKKWKQK